MAANRAPGRSVALPRGGNTGRRRASPPSGGPRHGRPSQRSHVAASSIGFLGREEELFELAGLLERERLITLTGAPGIGKTRLARELSTNLSKEVAGGVHVVDLVPIARQRDVPRAVAAALSLPEQPGEEITDTVVARLSHRRALLVLDNCEHVVEGAAGLVDALLAGCPELSILATSRQALGVSAERIHPVPPMSVPDRCVAAAGQELLDYEAVRLFVERARGVEPAFSLNAYVAPAVAEICRRLDGIPLAIELAAARVETHTPAEIAHRLDDRFDLLTDGSPSDLAHHQTLAAALDWSHGLLSKPEQALLRRLSVFVGGFWPEAAAEVCAGDELEAEKLPQLLDQLVLKSLVVTTAAGLRETPYRLLETIRAYAAERLERSGEQAQVRRRHADFYLTLAEEAEPQLTGPRQEPWLRRLEIESENLRAAIEWSLGRGESEWALRLTGALVLFWRVRCHFSRGRELLEAALSASNGGDSALKAKALWGAGFMTMMAGDYEEGAPLVEQSLGSFRPLGDLQGQARALLILGNCMQYIAPGSPLPVLEESARLARETGDDWCLAHALGVTGLEYARRGELDAARSLLEEGLEIAGAAQDIQGLRFGKMGLGLVLIRQGDYRSAKPVLEQTVALADQLGEDYTRAVASTSLGHLAIIGGDYSRARELLDDALARMRNTGRKGDLIPPLVLRAELAGAHGELHMEKDLLEEALALAAVTVDNAALALNAMGQLKLGRGHLLSAARMFEESLELARSQGEKRIMAQALHSLGWVARAEDDLKRSAVLFEEALQLHREIGDRYGITVLLEAIGGLRAKAGRHCEAVRLLGAAQALRDANGYVRMLPESARHDADLALVRDALSDERVRSGWEEGRRLSIEEAVTAASNDRRSGRPTTGWSSLTESEHEVAALVAEGLTNPQIADRVYVSLGTVKAHLSHIFSKLGVSTRHELAREVRRRRRQTGGVPRP